MERIFKEVHFFLVAVAPKTIEAMESQFGFICLMCVGETGRVYLSGHKGFEINFDSGHLWVDFDELEGVDINTVAGLANHASSSTTNKYRGRVDYDNVIKATEMLKMDN